MGPNAVRDLIDGDEAVARLLDSFCAGECDHTWACDGCPIEQAKQILRWSLATARIDEYHQALTPDQLRGMLRVVEGGKTDGPQ